MLTWNSSLGKVARHEIQLSFLALGWLLHCLNDNFFWFESQQIHWIVQNQNFSYFSVVIIGSSMLIRALKVKYHELFAIPHHLISTVSLSHWYCCSIVDKAYSSATCYLIFISLWFKQRTYITRETDRLCWLFWASKNCPFPKWRSCFVVLQSPL